MYFHIRPSTSDVVGHYKIGGITFRAALIEKRKKKKKKKKTERKKKIKNEKEKEEKKKEWKGEGERERSITGEAKQVSLRCNRSSDCATI